MKNIAKPLRTVLELGLLLALVLGLVAVFRSLTPGEPSSPPLEGTPYPPPGDEIPPNIPSPTGPYPPPVDPGPSPAWTDEPMPTEPSTPTDPPVPTLMPTPVVTSIPLAAPPFLPDLEGKTALPFWIYYWFDNQIWRVDSEGQNRELLLDAYESLGEWLTAVPTSASDCCTFGPRVSLSPDGLTIAFVVVDKEKLTYKGEPFNLSLYTFDIPTGEVNFIGKGYYPVWSPDSQKIAFLRDGNLSMVDLQSDEIVDLVTRSEEQDRQITEFLWSPDNRQIAYLYNDGFQRLPTIWFISLVDEPVPMQVIELGMFEIYLVKWLLDGNDICYLSMEGSIDFSSPHVAENLWCVSLVTQERTQLTHDLQIRGYGLLSGMDWFFITGYPLYEGDNQNHDNDLWLLSYDGSIIKRLTTNQGDIAVNSLSPDGTRLIVRGNDTTLATFSLLTGVFTPLPDVTGEGIWVGGLK